MSSPHKTYRKYTRHKSPNPPVRIAVNVDQHIKDSIERCAKSRDVSMNKVINEILENALPDLESQANMFENMKNEAPSPSAPSFDIEFPEVDPLIIEDSLYG